MKTWIRIAAAAIAVILLAFAAACGRNQAGPSSGWSSSPSAPSSGSVSSNASASNSPNPETPAADPSQAPATNGSAAGESSTAAAEKPSPSNQTPSQTSSGTPSSNPDPSSPPNSVPDRKTPEAEKAHTITLSVTGNAEWGSVVSAQTVPLHEGDTVSDVLVRTLKAHKLAYDSTGSGSMFYVTGIDGLFEFDDGPTSGWKFRINGKISAVGAGSCVLKPGDHVEWFYTSNDEEAAKARKEQSP